LASISACPSRTCASVTLVEDQLVAHRVRRYANDLADQHVVAQQRRGVEQRAQARVVGLHRGELLRQTLQHEVLPLQTVVVV
jgi:hypothetical protein